MKHYQSTYRTRLRLQKHSASQELWKRRITIQVCLTHAQNTSYDINIEHFWYLNTVKEIVSYQFNVIQILMSKMQIQI